MSTSPSNVYDIDAARYEACFAAGQSLAEKQIERFLDGSVPEVAEHALEYVNSVECMIEVLAPDATPSEVDQYTTLAMASLLLGSILGGLAISQTSLADFIQSPHPENSGEDPFDPFVNATCDEASTLIGGSLVRINGFMNARAAAHAKLPDDDKDLVIRMGADLLHSVQHISYCGPHTMCPSFVDEMINAGAAILEDWVEILKNRNLPIDAEAFELLLLVCASGFTSTSLLIVQPAATGVIKGYAVTSEAVLEEYDEEPEE